MTNGEDFTSEGAPAPAEAEAAPEKAPETPEEPAVEAPRPGGWVDVVEGEFRGRRGHFLSETAGFALVRTRDEFNQLIEVARKYLRASTYTGGR